MKYSDRPNAYINAKDLEIAVVKATAYGDALKAVREQPSIDIVFCEDCLKHKVVPFGENACFYWCELRGHAINPDDFCSYGERKTDE